MGGNAPSSPAMGFNPESPSKISLYTCPAKKVYLQNCNALLEAVEALLEAVLDVCGLDPGPSGTLLQLPAGS